MNNAVINSTFYVNSVFSDINQYAEVGKNWDIDFMQLSPGKLDAKLYIVNDINFQVFRTSFNQSLLQNGSSPKNLITFGLTRNRCVEFFWRGHRITGKDIFIFPINGEIATESRPDFDTYGLSFHPEYIEQVCEELILNLSLKDIRSTEILTVPDLSMQSLRLFLENTFTVIKNNISNFSRDNFRGTIKYEILKKLLLTIEPHLKKSKIKNIRLRDQAYKKAKDYIYDNLNVPLTVQELVKEANVSIRTLEYSFLERFGMRPKALLKSIRLNGVNRALKLADVKKTKLYSIANHWGFWHIGQFAKDYKEMFGELPSDTIRKSIYQTTQF